MGIFNLHVHVPGLKGREPENDAIFENSCNESWTASTADRRARVVERSDDDDDDDDGRGGRPAVVGANDAHRGGE